MFFGAIVLLVLFPILAPVIEVLLVGSVVYSALSHPVTLLPNWRWSLGMHPILGISAALLCSYYYLVLYANRLYAVLVGSLFTLIWTIGAFTHENDNRNLGQLLSGLFAAENWTRIETPQGSPSFLLAVFVLAASAFSRFYMHKFLFGGFRKTDGDKSNLGKAMISRIKRLAALLAFSTFCFFVLKACGSSTGLGR